MNPPSRPIAFVIAGSDYGPLIVNRFDYYSPREGVEYGVGHDILATSTYAADEVSFLATLLAVRREFFGNGVVAIDCGANIGAHTIAWARLMTGWGSVLAIEAQERIFYALAGNISINNCFNARAMHAAVCAESGMISMPDPDYLRPGTFGSLEIREKENNEYIGQHIHYSGDRITSVRSITLDSLRMGRVDLLKIDVEGMEIEALTGAEDLIRAHAPIITVEWLKSPKDQLELMLKGFDYQVFEVGINLFAVHNADPTLSRVKFTPSS